VSDQAWQAAKGRLASVNATFSNGRAAGLCSRSYTAQYLFSGFLKCGLCGSNIVLLYREAPLPWDDAVVVGDIGDLYLDRQEQE